jgi:glucose-6-phosphate isomerase
MDGSRDKYIFVTRVRSIENYDGAIRPAVFPAMPFHNRNIALGKILSAQAQAFERSLSESGVSFSSIVLEALNERTLGAYFMLWQMAIALTGEYLDVNAYDQPGVELGKKYAAQLILQ